MLIELFGAHQIVLLGDLLICDLQGDPVELFITSVSYRVEELFDGLNLVIHRFLLLRRLHL